MVKPKTYEGSTPDFIGTWAIGELDLSEGLFYLYFYGGGKDADNPNIKNFTGSIDDKFGSAEVYGKMTEDWIRFTKFYDEKARKKGASPSAIKYGAKKVEGIYIGKYQMKEINSQILCFVGGRLEETAEGKFMMYSPIPENQLRIIKRDPFNPH